MQRRWIWVILLLGMMGLTASAQTDDNTDDLPNVYTFPTGYQFRYPDGWEVEVADDVVTLYSDDTILQVFDTLDSTYTLVELAGIFGEGYFEPNIVDYYTLPDGRDAARADYLDSYGDEAMDIGVAASDGTFGYFAAFTYEGLLTERDLIIQIAYSYDVEDGTSEPTTGRDRERAPQIRRANDRTQVPFVADQYAAGTYVDAICPFYILPPEVEGSTVDCGYLIVPESRTTPTDGNIQLMVMQIQSRNPSNNAPIVYLEGGPGGGAIPGYEYWYSSALRNDHDIILIDQRGTGFSLPSLNCTEYDGNGFNVTNRCAARLRDVGVNLSAYNSAESADDVADLVLALNLPEYNLYGVSYGTRLALTVMRDRPERIRSVMLESVYPPQVAGYDEQAINADAAFNALFDYCAADAACNAVYPNLRDIFYETIETLNRRPLNVYNHAYGYEDGEMTGDVLVDELFVLQYEYAWLPYIPALVYAAYNRDEATYSNFDPYGEDFTEYSDEYYAALDEALLEYTGYESYTEMYDYLDNLNDDEYFEIEDAVLGYIDSDSEGIFNSVTCVDEIPFNSVDGFESTSSVLAPTVIESVRFGVEVQYDDCAIWDVTPAPQIETKPVTSDIPTLVMSGTFDPITPPIWGDAAAEFLPNSTHVVFPMGHGTVDLHPCPTDVALAFLSNPTSQLKTGCVADMSIDFYMGD